MKGGVFSFYLWRCAGFLNGSEEANQIVVPMSAKHIGHPHLNEHLFSSGGNGGHDELLSGTFRRPSAEH